MKTSLSNLSAGPLLSLAVLFATACGMETEPPGTGEPASVTDPEGPVEDPAQSTMAPPMVDPTSGSVCVESVAITGTAQPGASVIVFGGSSSAVSTDAHPSSGRYCLDVPLVMGTLNSLDVVAQDPLLGTSVPVTITVEQNASCNTDDAKAPEPVDAPEPRNVALGSTVTAKDTPSEGNLPMLVDGKTTTVVQFKRNCSAWDVKCHFADYNGWVAVKLDKITELSQIVVKWKDSSGDFGQKYQVLVSTMPEPGDAKPSNGYWSPVATVTKGNGGTDTFTMPENTIALQVALYLQADAATSSAETFSLREMEIWDKPAKPMGSGAPLTPPGQSCATLSGE